jgi:hypothetical protein
MPLSRRFVNYAAGFSWMSIPLQTHYDSCYITLAIGFSINH